MGDEPISALDVSVQGQVLNLFSTCRSAGLRYFFIAHGLSVVEHVSDRVAVMYLGQLVETATAAAIFSGPATRIRRPSCGPSRCPTLG